MTIQSVSHYNKVKTGQTKLIIFVVKMTFKMHIDVLDTFKDSDFLVTKGNAEHVGVGSQVCAPPEVALSNVNE